jgi:hypothetical protein
VRPKKSYLEICFFLGRKLKDSRVHTAVQTSKVKFGHIIRVKHRDEIESPITDWIKEAYDVSDNLRPEKTKRKKLKRAPKKRKQNQTSTSYGS